MLVTPVTPSRTLSSLASAVTEANLLISAAVALMSVPPRFNEVVLNFPVTDVELLIETLDCPNVINSTLLECPILELLITTSSTFILPAVTSLVPISIFPNPLAIEPEESAPVVTIPVPPAIGA